MSRRRLMFPVLLALGASMSVMPTQPSAAQTTAPAMNTFRVLQQRPDRLIAELPNRMIVVATRLPTAPVVSAQVWVKTGSIYEQEFVGAGLSHFLEHLLSGGTTTTRTEAQTNELLGRIGAQVNAATGLDNVHYYINTTRPYAETAIELLSDWMQNSTIPPAEFERERQVIQNEFDMGQGEPGRIFWKLTQAARYRVHPARHPTIGYLEDFLKISREQIVDFYHRMYVPNNMVFAVVGDIDPPEVVKHIAALWADVPARPLPTVALPVEGELDHPVKAQGAADIDAPRLRLAWPGTRMTEEGDYALDLLAVILGQGESSRLVESVRDQQRLANSINAYNLSFPWGKGFFGIDAEIALPPAATTASATTAPAEEQRLRGAIATTRQAIVDQVWRIQQQGVTEAELARAKRQTLVDVLLSAQTAEGMALRVASDIVGMADPDYLFRYAEAIQSVSAVDVQAAARRFLRSQDEIDVVLLPAGEGRPVTGMQRPLPPEAAAAQMAQEPAVLDNEDRVARMQNTLSAAAAEAPVAAVGPVEEKTLSNGLRVLVNRNTVVPGVAIQFYHRGGLLADDPGREGLANAAAVMLTRGTKNRSAQQIAREVEQLGASLSTDGGRNSFYAQAVALAEDWPKLMELVADVVMNPAFPGDEWQRRQQRLLADIDRLTDTWSGELGDLFRKTYYGQHVWSQPTAGRREAVASFTPGSLKEFYFSHLGASEAVLAIFGDVDPQAVFAAAEKAFASLPAQPADALAIAAPAPPQLQIVQEQTGKPLAAVQFGLGPGITRDDPDYAALQVLSKIVSNFPSGWLEQALRGEGKGLAYAVGAGTVTGFVPGYFSVVFNTKPADVIEAAGAAAAVVARAREAAVTPEQLERARAAVLTEEFFGRQTNSDRAAQTALDVLYGLGPDAAEKLLQDVRAVTPADIERVAREHLRVPVVAVISAEKVDEAALRAAVAPLLPVELVPPAQTQPATQEGVR